MTAMHSISRAATIAMLCLARAADAQAPSDAAAPAAATLAGTVLVVPARQPVPGVEITIPQLSLSARSAEDGTYRIAGIAPGTYAVSIRQLGYFPVTVQLAFAAGQSVTQEFLLARAQTLDTISVIEQRITLVAFEERRKSGIGSFLTRDDIAKVEFRRMAEVLFGLPGLRIRKAGSGQAYVTGARGMISMNSLRGPRGAKDCYSDLYLDGMLIYGGGSSGEDNTRAEPLFDINKISPVQIEGIEYYSGGARIPAQYNRTGSACGVLLLWTRRD